MVMLLTLPFIVSAYLYKVLSPFSLKGPQFLVFFLLLAISCIICYIILQYEKGRLLKELVAQHFPTDASAFQIAQFLYGKHRAVQTGIVDLIRRNLVGLTYDKRFSVHKKRYSQTDNEQNPLIPGLLNEQCDDVNYQAIANEWYNEETTRHPALQKLYLLAYYEESFLKRYHVLLIPFTVALARLFQGTSKDKPVGFLIVETVVLFVVSIFITWLFSRKKMVFDKAKALTKDNQVIGANDAVVSDFAMNGTYAISGFAEGVLLATVFAPFPVLDHIRKNRANFSCSSCSGGGCSGGDGGGGCGGGCGGCGGCGS
jgi:uncharacterized protein (TIGR04222 family)